MRLDIYREYTSYSVVTQARTVHLYRADFNDVDIAVRRYWRLNRG